MKRHRTALGKMIDMSELVAKNEKTRAVGNMRVNARGDTIDSFGKIVEPVTSKVNTTYSKTVGNKSAQPVRQQQPRQVRRGNDPGSPMKNGATVPVRHTPAPAPEPVQPELTEAELELEQELMDDVEVENIKARESE